MSAIFSVMQEFLRRFLTNWRRLNLEPDSRVLIAVSGGADSVALAVAFGILSRKSKLPQAGILAYFDHLIRDTGQAEAFLVKEIAERYELEFATGQAETNPPDSGLEEWARSERYRFLSSAAKESAAKYVLTGHHQDDRIETFFINLLRGSGVKGLSSMREIFQLDEDVQLVRPLSKWATKSMLREFCSLNELSFIDDPTNQSKKHFRNRVRHGLIPKLNEFTDTFGEMTLRSIDLIERSDRTIDYLFENEISLRSFVASDEIAVRELNEHPEYVRQVAIQYWLKRLVGDQVLITKSSVDSVVALAASQKSGRVAQLGSGFQVEKKGGFLTCHEIA